MWDLLIIGGGPGGYVAAIRARQLGMTVALVEKDAVGGTCLNRGCIPTKAYYRNALAMRDIRNSQEFNIQVENVSFDMAGARQRKDTIVNGLVTGVEKLLQANGVEKIIGRAALQDKNTVMVNGERIQARNILLATGSIPASLPIPGIDLPGVMNSDQLLELTSVPRRLTIIGGGVIGLEFACIFNSLGSQVTVFEYLPEILSTMDHELGKRLRVFLKKQKIVIHSAMTVERFETSAGALKVTATGKRGRVENLADVVLAAGGRKACTTGLNLEQLGISMNNYGFIQVDHRFCTNVEGVYAIGDVIGGPMLAHVASAEGIAAVENMADGDQGDGSPDRYSRARNSDQKNRPLDRPVPACVFTIPEIASVGLSEEEAKSQGIPYRTGKFQFAANGKALTLGETDGMVKVLADSDDVIIGVHIIGPHASDLIMEGTMMVESRLKVTDISQTIHPHPTLSEAVLEAVLDIYGQAIHLAPPKTKKAI